MVTATIGTDVITVPELGWRERDLIAALEREFPDVSDLPSLAFNLVDHPDTCWVHGRCGTRECSISQHSRSYALDTWEWRLFLYGGGTGGALDLRCPPGGLRALWTKHAR